MLTLSKEVVYVPEFDGEREKAKKEKGYEPIKFIIKPMKHSERMALAVENEKLKDGGATKEMLEFVNKVCREHLIRIEGIVLDGEEIDTYDKLMEAEGVPQELIDELQGAILPTGKAQGMSDGEIKN